MGGGRSGLVVGVDVGNTKTVAVVCDRDGRACGIGRGGCGNWEGVGEKGSAQVVTEVIEEALAMAGARRSDVEHVHIGMAGIDWPDDEPRIRKALAEAGWESGLALENDGFLTVRAAAPEGYGIGVTAGTGICCAIVQENGGSYFYGAYTDLGGGHHVGAQAFQAVLRAEDGRGRPTALTEALLEATGHESTRDLVYDVHRRGKHLPGTALNVVLFATAAKGDEVAVEIVTQFGRELALCATNLIRRYGLATGEPAVVAAGSRFMRTGPLLFEVFSREVRATCPGAQLILSEHPPVAGAVRGALQAWGGEAAAIWRRVERSMAETGWFAADVSGGSEGDGDE